MASTNTLGDSWVVSDLEESTVIIKGNSASSSQNLTPPSSSESESYQETDHATSSATDLPDLTESTATLASSTSSGPELIMPSIIFDSRTSDHGSWVIPRKRSKQSLYESRKAPRLPKPSRNHLSAHEQEHRNHHNITSLKNDRQPSPTAAATAATSDRGALGYFAQIKSYLSGDLERYEFFRLLLNSLLVLMVMHLLIFPEVVHQVPIICRVPPVSRIYNQTCAGRNRNVSEIASITANFQSAVRTQTQLQIYLNQTIEDMAPVDLSLKDSDAILRGIYTDIRNEYGGARHEIELEFEGIWVASRAITRALTNLKVDIKATVDGFQLPPHRYEYIKGARSNRQASGNIINRLLFRGLSDTDKQEPNINQFGRLNQELDSALTRLAHKTDTLLVQLAKLDDHLQSIKQLSVREHYRLQPQSSDTNQMDNVWVTLSGFIRGPRSSSPVENNEKENTILNELEQIASYHDLMADIVGKLDRELKALQKIRAIRG
ncbi:hypothetical protein UA08_00995 [Talaromyces atroroseus]|uniref:Uncharacterized protein n=1 Tax=Talaromyces atroroseus TaxID=1441469 RepID=A0A225B8P2_TALAT|nr:hypothetical protein UA08_00995 [Talaromyces atroroseus]OKL64469.1 hypothetical protein UA08_00995 [Talaromyces atroroseus]